VPDTNNSLGLLRDLVQGVGSASCSEPGLLTPLLSVAAGIPRFRCKRSTAHSSPAVPRGKEHIDHLRSTGVDPRANAPHNLTELAHCLDCSAGLPRSSAQLRGDGHLHQQGCCGGLRADLGLKQQPFKS